MEEIRKRELDRKLTADRKRENKLKLVAQNEKIDYFAESFETKRKQIETALSHCQDSDSHSLPSRFDEISKEILTLQKHVAASNLFLRTYDVKIFNESLQDLTLKARQLEDRLLPKKKFGFRGKKPVRTATDSRDVVDFCRPLLGKFDDFGFADKHGETLTLTGNQVAKQDVTLRNLTNCTVKILGTPSTLNVSQLKNCLITSGPVSTSIFAENCSESFLVIACQQLRLHSSHNLHIYLHVTSRAILEDCSRISVAPYNLSYSGIERDFAESGLERNVNNWRSIGDFNWLNAEVESPNWGILEADKRVGDWDCLTLKELLESSS